MNSTLQEKFKDRPIPVLEYYSDWMPGDKRPDHIELHPFHARETLFKSASADSEIFAGEADAGWCPCGIVVFARVTDQDFTNRNPVDKLWCGSSVEVIIRPAGERDFAVGGMLQVLAAPPEGDGSCRFYCCGGDTAPGMKYVQCSGVWTCGGYELTIFIPWEAMGDGSRDILMEDGCRLNIKFNNNGGTVKTINGKIYLTVQKEASPEFLLAKEFSPDHIYDLEVRYALNNNGIPAIPGETVSFDTGTPCVAVLEDSRGRQIAKISFPDGRVAFTMEKCGCFSVKVFIEDASFCKFILRRDILVSPLDELSRIFAAPVNPAQRLIAAGMVSTVECFKSKTGVTDIETEMEVRQRLLAGEDVADAPGILRYLNLMGDPAGLVHTGIARCFVNGQCVVHSHARACVTVQWGGIPLLYGDVLIFGSPEAAEAEMLAAGFMRTKLPAPAVSGADEVYAGEGFSLGSALATDFDPEHLVGVINRDVPKSFMRAEICHALAVKPAAFAINGQGDPEHIRILRENNIPEIPMAEAGSVEGHVIVLGSEMPGDWNGVYFQSLNGIMDRCCWARKGNTVFRTSYSVPEIAVEVLEAFIACRPIPFAAVDRWRKLKLEALGGDLPEYREQGRLIRTGEVHCHSNYSDGAAAPGTFLMDAAACGMDFMILTDHNATRGAELLADALKKSGIRYPFVIGEEITMSDAYHLNVFPLVRKILQERKSYAELVAEARAQGAVVMLNHPMSYGVNLKQFWYGTPEKSGIDVFERNVGQRERWLREGCETAFLGSTDSHWGIFGHFERSVFMAEEITGETIAGEVLAKRCGMIAPYLPELVYGNELLCKAVRAALGDETLPELHEKRLDRAFAGCDLSVFCKISPDGSNGDMCWGWMGDPSEKITPIEDR